MEGNCPGPIHAQDTLRKLGVEWVPIQTTKTLQGVRALPNKEGASSEHSDVIAAGRK